jgi:hypothetical protein
MNNDYPRMLFHRTKEPVTVQNRDEEYALGKEWSRTIWPAADAAEPDAPAAPEPEPEPAHAPAPAKHPTKPPVAAKHAPKKRW